MSSAWPRTSELAPFAPLFVIAANPLGVVTVTAAPLFSVRPVTNHASPADVALPLLSAEAPSAAEYAPLVSSTRAELLSHPTVDDAPACDIARLEPPPALGNPAAVTVSVPPAVTTNDHWQFHSFDPLPSDPLATKSSVTVPIVAVPADFVRKPAVIVGSTESFHPARVMLTRSPVAHVPVLRATLVANASVGAAVEPVREIVTRLTRDVT